MAIARASAIARDRRWLAPLWVVALVGSVPIIVVVANVGALASPEVAHLARTVLPRYLLNTLALVATVTLAASAVGTVTAWLVTVYQFPGRSILSWLLVLPLALPPFVAAITYTGVFDFSGPVQALFRDTMGMAPGTYPIVRVRGFGGLALLLTSVLYPYVYLTARASFASQSARVVEIARSHGHRLRSAFFRAAVPAARPSLVGGAALVAMETAGEFGASSFLGVDTLTTGVFRAWFALGSQRAAIALAAVLLLIAAALIVAELRNRGHARYDAPGLHHRQFARHDLARRGWWATAACGTPVIVGFAIPFAQLLTWTVKHGGPEASLLTVGLTTVGLAAVATVTVVSLGVLAAYAARLAAVPAGGARGETAAALLATATAGYAIPAAVLAVGVATALTWVDRRIIEMADWAVGAQLPLLTTGTVIALLVAYAVRFFAIGHNGAVAGLSQVSVRFDEVARSLGARPLTVLVRAVLPPARPALVTTAVLVMIEALKELPLTLILRPFGVDTLATEVFRFAGAEQIARSAPYSLVIVLLGALAVPLLSGRTGTTTRPA